MRVAALAAIVLAAVAMAAAVVLGSRSAPRAAAGAGVPAGYTTAEVTRRTLSESATLDGTLGYTGSLEVYDRLAEAGTFTWLPAVGATVARGGTLFRVNEKPVALMYGSVPAYRTLREGVKGPDVRQLNESLIDLGDDPEAAIGSDLDHFGEATAAAVRRWQKAEGLAQTGKVELGRVVFASGPQRVTKVHVALGQDPPGADREKLRQKGKRRRPKATSRPPKEPASKEPASKEPVAKAKNPPANGGGEKTEGNSSGAGTLALSTTSTRQIVRMQVKASEQQLAHVGESAPVTLPNGEMVKGHITEVGTVASESSEGENGGDGGKGSPDGGGGGSGEKGGENATVAVTIALERRVARLDAAPVSVELVKQIRRNVLAAPATALTATGGGTYALQTLEGGRRVDVPVTPGMFAGGYVQVEGPGVREGMTVIESQ